MIPGMNKSAGVRRLCVLAGIDPRRTAIIYAGDDENDAQAMEWVLGRGGSAISVGDRPLAAGSLVVSGPGLLAAAVRKLLSRLPKSAESRL
jgi:trehalose-6-phosphatase